MNKIAFEYELPIRLELSMPLIRKTLREVQAQLLSHEINGGTKKLEMDTTTQPNSCRMAACIGGWASLFLLGFEGTKDNNLEPVADELFMKLIEVDNEFGRGRLWSLFHDYRHTNNYDQPNVAATAIERYLKRQDPWPIGDMPNVMAYTKRAPAKRTAKRVTKKPAKRRAR